MNACSAVHNLAAFSTSVSSTGCKSNADRLITFSTSPVAVCCSNALGEITVAFLQLLEQPDVLDGNYSLVGESLQKLDLRRGEGAHLGAT